MGTITGGAFYGFSEKALDDANKRFYEGKSEKEGDTNFNAVDYAYAGGIGALTGAVFGYGTDKFF